jgi:hypothetical protein
VQIGAAFAKSASARCVQDSVDDGLPIRVLWTSIGMSGTCPFLTCRHSVATVTYAFLETSVLLLFVVVCVVLCVFVCVSVKS